MTSLIRKDTSNHYRKIRKILKGSDTSYYEEESTHKNYLGWALWPIVIGICLAMLHGCEQTAHAFTDKEAIKTIVGEASNQGYIGMVAVGEVIRHKGSLRGFYGFKAKHSANEPAWVWKMAKKAWFASNKSNLTHHADHFENTHAFGCPYWVKNCVETFRYRDHIFFREVV